MMSMRDGIDRVPVVDVDINLLILSESPRLSGECHEHVEILAGAQQPLPPIIVHRSTMRVIDGFHRLRAAVLRGQETIQARFFDGDAADAFVLAVQQNIAHGLPLAMADRKRAAARIILSHPQWSDRRVAGVTGVSSGTIAEIRRHVLGELQPDEHRVGQDGRVRPLDGSAGRQLAGQLLTENPDLSLRQVARAAGISPETARDVRRRLLDGRELVPAHGKKDLDNGRERALRHATVGHHRMHARLPKGPIPDRAAVLNWLKADPALRYTERGRNLLRLIMLHMQWTGEWDAIMNDLPPHCSGAVADLARQFADLWTEFAVRAEASMAEGA